MNAKQQENRRKEKAADRIHTVKLHIEKLKKVIKPNNIRAEFLIHWRNKLKELQENSDLLALSVNLTE